MLNKTVRHQNAIDADSTTDEAHTLLLKTVQRAYENDRDAFSDLYMNYKKPLGSYLMTLVNNEEVAKEIYQETFTRAWKHLSEVRNPSHFKPWLYTIAKNIAIDHLRRETGHTVLSFPESVQYSHAGHEVYICNKIILAQALSQMSPRYRECVVLQMQWGYSQKDIAKALQISEKAVSSNVSRGFQQLRGIYKDMMGESDTNRKGDRSDENFNAQ